MARLGVMGGTFNPPHVGHQVCASDAADQLALDRVLWVPVHTPPHKELVPGAPGPERRVELCRLATRDDPRFEVCTLEVERGGNSYSVDTLRQLRERYPGDELVFIVGADTALSLPTWHRPEEVVQLASLGIAGRQGVLRSDIVERLAGFDARLQFFAMPRIDVSSSEVRRRLAGGQAIDYLVPEPVADAIRREGLYRSQVTA